MPEEFDEEMIDALITLFNKDVTPEIYAVLWAKTLVLANERGMLGKKAPNA